MPTRRRRPFLPWLDPLDERCLLSGYQPIEPAGYTPAQIRRAYGLDAITFPAVDSSAVVGDGSGQTIALIEMYHHPYIESDLAEFDRMFGLPSPPRFTVINQAGNQTDSGWAME